MKSSGAVFKLRSKSFPIPKETKNLSQNKGRYQEKTSNLDERLITMENNSRKNNVTTNGIKTLKEENKERLQVQVSKLMTSQLGIDVTLERLQRVGREESGKARPVLVQFGSESDKVCCFKAVPKLKGTDICYNKDRLGVIKNIRNTENRRTPETESWMII